MECKHQLILQIVGTILLVTMHVLQLWM